MRIHITVALATATLLILPDYIFDFFITGYAEDFCLKNYAIYGGLLLLSALIVKLPSFLAQCILFLFFSLLSFFEFCHFSYYGSLIHHYEIPLVFREWKEISETLEAIQFITIQPAFSAFVPLILLLFIIKKFGTKIPKTNKVIIPLILVFSILPVKAFFSDSDKRFEPASKYHSLKNGIYTISYFGGKMIWSSSEVAESKSFELYKVSKTTQISKKMNIVVVMGESLSYSRMGLFGHSRNNTPLLQKITVDPHFVHRKGISASSATTVTIPMFFNIIREPGNMRPLISQTSNLFKMAQEQNFITHFYSHQDVKEAVDNYLKKGNINYLKGAVDYDPTGDEVTYDKVLLDDLKKVDFSKNNFVVLNQRSTHSPYEKNYPKKFEKYKYNKKNFHQYMTNSYDNSVFYCDYFFSELIQMLKDKTEEDTETLLFVTSDHAELLGENGKFGHTILDINVGKVPFIYYGINTDLTPKIRTIQDGVTHYEIAKTISKVLGYDFENPNEDGTTFYFNGNSLSGDLGYLTLSKKDLNL